MIDRRKMKAGKCISPVRRVIDRLKMKGYLEFGDPTSLVGRGTCRQVDCIFTYAMEQCIVHYHLWKLILLERKQNQC